MLFSLCAHKTPRFILFIHIFPLWALHLVNAAVAAVIVIVEFSSLLLYYELLVFFLLLFILFDFFLARFLAFCVKITLSTDGDIIVNTCVCVALIFSFVSNGWLLVSVAHLHFIFIRSFIHSFRLLCLFFRWAVNSNAKYAVILHSFDI